ncbi:RHS repeat domain-containing protein [Ideonella sp. BN130291]|uniref:RHS repeat domain-containing protein n=1 Tax=Ideonella sp. BN130291 TaxID=3112940 RepID=UPI002E26AF28|nr:Ig-like domain-containing protein [Ideonella sp. BN130291]
MTSIVWRRAVVAFIWPVLIGLLLSGQARASCSFDSEVNAWFPDSGIGVSVTSPANGSNFIAPAAVNLQVSLTNTANEIISRVDYLDGTTVIAQSTASPWSATWNAGTAGSYALKAKVTHKCKSPTTLPARTSTSASVAVTVTSASIPSVSLGPVSNSALAPATIQLSATATDSSSTITRVEFWANGSIIGTVTEAPYQFRWVGVAAGQYSLQARAYNARGGVGSSGSSQAIVNAASTFPAVSLSETRTSVFDYDTTTGLLIKEVIEPGSADLCVATDYGYDNWGNRKTVTVRNCSSATVIKVPGGYPETTTAAANALPAARTTTVFYDGRGQFPSGRMNALGQLSSEAHGHKTGALEIFSEINGLTTAYTNDAFGRRIAELRSDGTSTTWTYGWTPTGIPGCTEGYDFGFRAQPYICYANVRKDFDSQGTAVHPGIWEYFDRLDRKVVSSRISLDGSDWIDEGLTWFDNMGRVAYEYKPYMRSRMAGLNDPLTAYSYDVLGRVTGVKEQLFLDAHSRKQISYEGTRTVTTFYPSYDDPKQVTVQDVNAAGQVSVVYDAKGGRVRYDYTAFGQLAATDAQGVLSTASYDGRGRKKNTVDPDAGNWQYLYNVAGELTRQTNPKTQSTSLEYDKLGRMTKRSEPEMVATWVYDTPNATNCSTPANRAKGQLTQVLTASGYGYNRYLCHDDMGRLNKQVVDIDGNLFTTGVSFDGAGRQLLATYPASPSFPSGLQIKHVYNPQGYLTHLQNSASSAPIWQLTGQNAYGLVTGETLGAGGATIVREYDLLGRPSQITAGSGGAIQNEGYTYNYAGIPRTRTWTIGGVARTETLVHDELNRLVSVSGASNKSYTFDLQGNLVSKPEVGTYNYTPGTHRLASITGTVNGVTNPSFSYEPSGAINAGAGLTASWTSFDMPTVMTRGSTSDTFKYGAEHQRVKQISSPAPGSASGSLTTFYLSNFEKEINTATGITEYKHYIAAGGRTIAVWIDRSNGTNEWRFLHQDRLGSVVAVSDYNGNVTERMSYDAWGKRRNIDATDLGATPVARTDRGYTGHEMLDNIGLVHMNGRIYDPLLGRFISADPLIDQMMNPQAFNRYSYVLNSPLTLTDPTGLSPWVHVREGIKVVALYVVGDYLCGGYCGAALAGAYNGYQQRHDGTGAAIGAVNGLISYEIGQQFPVFQNGEFQGWQTLLTNASAHAVQGCATASALGGSCKQAAAAQFTASALGPALDEALGTANSPWMILTRGIAGGAGAVAAGGRFEEGFDQGVLEGVTNAASEFLSAQIEASRAMDIAANRALGVQTVNEEIWVRTNSGVLFRPDFMNSFKDGYWMGDETKSGLYSRFTRKQNLGIQEFAQGKWRFEHASTARKLGLDPTQLRGGIPADKWLGVRVQGYFGSRILQNPKALSANTIFWQNYYRMRASGDRQ